MYWIIIPIVAILGSYFISYQKMKMKQISKGTAQDLEDMNTLVNSLKKRIENLEAIAAESDEMGTDDKIGNSSREAAPGRKRSRGGSLDNMLNQP